MSSTKMFTSAGITLHSRDDVVVNKVRFGTDHIRMVKTLNSSKKIGVSYNFGGRDNGYLDPQRVDIVELPTAMTKEDAVQYLLTHEAFQSPADQVLLQEAAGTLVAEPKAKKSAAVKATVSLEAIKARAEKQAALAEGQMDEMDTEYLLHQNA